MAAVDDLARTAPPQRTRRPVPRGDLLGVGLLLAIPILLYLPFSLAGHPLIPGDDLTQNYPLRVLAGQLIRSGHLPTWDPYIWSGTPLLSGWNAGALYPGTLLFAVIPPVAAWTANLVLVSATCGVGVYTLLRVLNCGFLGATLGALCFTYAGFMSGQLNHIGLVQGTGYVPWMLVAIELLARSASLHSKLGPILLLGVASGLCVLAGEPRAISSAVVIAVVYLLARLTRLRWRDGMRLAAATAIGVALGTGVSAIQWLPGLAFVARSQRSLDAYAAFGTGSLSWITIGHDLLVPFLLGAYGVFGLPHYVGGYNLPELTIGVGLLPLVAACALLPDLRATAVAALRRRSRRRGGLGGDHLGSTALVEAPTPRPALGVWYVTGLVGLALTLGTSTPLGRLLADLPLYGGQRLQNRNAVIFDFALAMLLGFYVDNVVSPRTSVVAPEPAKAAGPGRASAARALARRVVASTPVLACLALIAIAYLHPKGLQARFNVAVPVKDLFVRLSPYLGLTAALAIATAVFVFLGHRLGRRVAAVFIGVVSCVDTGIYAVNASYATVPSRALAGSSSTSRQLHELARGGRVALYNPVLLAGSAEPPSPAAVAAPDLNILSKLMSVQGYSSIVSGNYEVATSTHDLEDLDPAVLRNGVADTLDLRVLLTLPAYLEVGIPPHSPIPVAGRNPVTGTSHTGVGAKVPATAPDASGPWTVPPRSERNWFLPSVSSVVRVTVVVDSPTADRSLSLEVGVSGPGRHRRLERVKVSDGEAHLTLGSPTPAESVIIGVDGDRAVTIGAVVVVTRSPDDRLLLDGALQGSLTSPQWSFGGTLGGFSVFLNAGVAGAGWLQALDTRSPLGADRAAGTVTAVDNSEGGSQQMLVAARHPSLLVRSVAFQPGWSAEVTPVDGGPVRSLAVKPLGLLQSVRIPAGHYRVTWQYASRSLVAGGGLTLSSTGLCAVLAAVAFVTGRRRSRSARPATPEDPAP